MTTGHEKVKVSFSICCSADGDVLPLTIVIPRATPLPNFIPPANVHVVYKPRSKTFDSDVIEDHFINGVLYPHMLRKGQRNSIMFWDHAPCHLTQSVQIKAHKHGIGLEYIPKRMTQLLQPGDVSWMRFIKAEYLKLWQDWFLNSDKSFTRYGNMRSPGYVTVIQWLSQIMEKLALNKDLIIHSFNITGITQSDPERFHGALKHVLSTNETTATILEDLDGTEDLAEMFVDDDENEDDLTIDDDDETDDYDDDVLSDNSSVLSESEEEIQAPLLSQITEPESDNEDTLSSIINAKIF